MVFVLEEEPEHELFENVLQRLLFEWMQIDDVLSLDFFNRLVVPVPQLPRIIHQQALLSTFELATTDFNVLSCDVIRRSAEKLRQMASGPYYRHSNGLHKVFRVYRDTQDAFFSAITQTRGSYCWVFTEQRPTTCIPVPSRIYSLLDSSELKLSGLRFGVKDVFSIQGLRVSVGSRSYHNLYPQRDQTARAIEELISAGAILVGMTKNTQFANGEDPQEWIDYACPWNPRGIVDCFS